MKRGSAEKCQVKKKKKKKLREQSTETGALQESPRTSGSAGCRHPHLDDLGYRAATKRMRESRRKPTWSSICASTTAERESTMARTFALARRRMKVCASSEKRPPISPASTTNYARTLRRRAASRATPLSSAQRRCGSPFARRSETRVVSIANWAPWNAGSKSRKKTLVETLPGLGCREWPPLGSIVSHCTESVVACSCCTEVAEASEVWKTPDHNVCHNRVRVLDHPHSVGPAGPAGWDP